MPTYKLTARHTPLRVKQLEVEAASPEEAVEKLIQHNLEAVAKFKGGPEMAKAIERWAAADRSGVEVVLVPAVEEPARRRRAPAVPREAEAPVAEAAAT